MGQRFASKVGGLWWAVMAAPLLPLIVGLLAPAWPAVAIAAVFWAILLWLLADTWYEIRDGELRVRCGPCRWRVPLATIDSVETAPPLEARTQSGPALSLDRMLIRYRNSGGSAELVVSPADRAGFLAAMSAGRGRAG